MLILALGGLCVEQAMQASVRTRVCRPEGFQGCTCTRRCKLEGPV